jgi:DNA mismatch repair protein MSH5
LFGIMNQCRTSIGKKILRKWFLRPLVHGNMIKERQDTIEFFLRAANNDLVAALTNNLRRIKDLQRILGRIRTSSSSVTDWCLLMEV